MTLDNGEVILLEINAIDKKYVRYRNFIYLVTKYSNYVKRGDEYEKYTKIPKHSQINFTWGLKDKKIKRTYKMQDNEKRSYIDNLEITLIQYGHGYTLWLCKDGIYFHDGKEGQYVIVVPSKNMVITITANDEKHRHDILENLRYLI